LNYKNAFQLQSTCDYCPCNQQIKTVAVTQTCTRFDTNCDGLIWADWDVCQLPEGSPCGVGVRSRLRSCGPYTNFDNVQKMCYDPWVKRTGSDIPDMENHPDYYQTESCYVQCPLWGPWSPCTAPPGGVGIQIRFDQSDPSIQDVKQCTNDVPVGPKESEVHYGPCNTACGVGKRQKGMFNDFYFIRIDVRLRVGYRSVLGVPMIFKYLFTQGSNFWSSKVCEGGESREAYTCRLIFDSL